MPKLTKTNKSSVNPQKKVSQMTCAACGEVQKISSYYVSYNIVHQTGRIPYCKDCLKKMISDESGNVTLDKLQSTLQLIDRPFIFDLWKIALDDKMDTFGCYMKNLCLMQNRKLTWKNSVFKPQLNNELNYSSTDKNMNPTNSPHFDVTNEMVLKWGTKYEPEEYYELENFYNDMMRTNTIETTQDMIYLKKLAIISLKMDNELEEGNYDEAKKLGDLFSKYMADSKFRAMDKTDADRTGGIRNFSTIYAEVESDGFIPPWEYYRKIKGITQDIVDKTIMHIENFTLKLNKVEKMIIPPLNTPKLEEDEIDRDNIIVINDIEVDVDFDGAGIGDD